jgi:hypothetical protein
MGGDRPLSQYLPGGGENMLFVLDILRSDQGVEIFKFLSRANYSSETVEHLGKITLTQPCVGITWIMATIV